MKSFSGKLALAVATAALLTTTAYAQMTSDTAQPNDQTAVNQPMVHHPIHHTRTAYHTGAAHHRAAIYNQAAGYGTGGYVSAGQPTHDVYNAAVAPIGFGPGVACLGGRGPGYYPNPVAYDESASTIISGGEFTLERGYPGCFGYFGE